MLPRLRILAFVALPCALFSLTAEASAQVGRLFGNVAYLEANRRVSPARGARVIAAGGYGKAETRTDNNGNFGFVLPAGTYKVYGQGLNGYTQRGDVMGYVRAYTDSAITPNPLLLVSVYFRSADVSRVPMNFIDTELPALEATTLMGEIALSRENTPSQVQPQEELAFVSGRVVYQKQGKEVPASQVYVQAFGSYERSRPARTNQEGLFELKLRPGSWRIYVQPVNGFHQRDVPTITVIKGEHISGMRITLVENRNSNSRE